MHKDFPADAQTPRDKLDKEQNPPHPYWQGAGGYIKVTSYLDYLAIIKDRLWVRVHNSPLVNTCFSALLAQKPDYQFRFHGTHFAAPEQRHGNIKRQRGHSFSNPTSTKAIWLTNSLWVHSAHRGEIRLSFLSFHNFVTTFILCSLSLGYGSVTSDWGQRGDSDWGN